MATTITLPSDFWEKHAYVRIRGRSRVAEEPQQVILENKIYMGSIQSQDDIYEGHPVFGKVERPERGSLLELARRHMSGASKQQIDEEADRLVARIANHATFAQTTSEIVTKLNDLYTQSSILSFFRTPFDQRNWAQYGDSGRGHAFVFDFHQPWPMECGQGMGAIDAVPFPVRYVPNGQIPPIPVKLGPYEADEGWRDIETVLLMKSDRWSDQVEERLFRVGIPQGFVHFPSQSLKAVVLGYDAPLEDERLMRELCENRESPLPLLRLEADRKEKRLDLRQIL